MKISVNKHASIELEEEIKIYFDPWDIPDKKDGDLIFITHNHYDHFDPKTVKGLLKSTTLVVCPKTIQKEVEEKTGAAVFPVSSNESYCLKGISFETIPAYNPNKKFHPKENQWVGYVVNAGGTSYYVMGDTDQTPEAKEVACDVLFIPVGGTYTMDYKEAAELTNQIKPKLAIPIHYGEVTGQKEDGERYKALVNENISVKLLLK